MKYFLTLFLLLGCTLPVTQVRRTPSSEKGTCTEYLKRTFRSSITLEYKTLWSRLKGESISVDFYPERYQETYDFLQDSKNSDLIQNLYEKRQELKFEDIMAYIDTLSERSIKASKAPEPISEDLFRRNEKAQTIIARIKRSYDSDEHLTRSEVRSLLRKYIHIRLGRPSIFKDGYEEVLKAKARNAFVYQVSHKSLYKALAHHGIKEPKKYQRRIDQFIRLYRSNIVVIVRNIWSPLSALRKLRIPGPVREVDFILDDEVVELILKYGFEKAWPKLRHLYKAKGYSIISFNAFSKIYAPVGFAGYYGYILWEMWQEREKMGQDDSIFSYFILKPMQKAWADLVEQTTRLLGLEEEAP